jgi:hypothetical protein
MATSKPVYVRNEIHDLLGDDPRPKLRESAGQPAWTLLHWLEDHPPERVLPGVRFAREWSYEGLVNWAQHTGFESADESEIRP